MSSRQSRSLSTQSTQTGRSLMPSGTAVDTPNGSLEMLARFVGRRISCPAPRLFVEPYVFQSEIVDDAVCHHRPALDPRLPAISKAVVEDDRSRAIRGELSLDLPNQLLALIDVALGRLPIEQLLQLRIAIACVVARRTAAIIFIELLVRIVDTAAREVEPDLVVFAHDLRESTRCFDDFEFAVDEHILQLVGQDHRRI